MQSTMHHGKSSDSLIMYVIKTTQLVITSTADVCKPAGKGLADQSPNSARANHGQSVRISLSPNIGKSQIPEYIQRGDK